ncbi:MAG TPA: hypothetical protein ENH80_12290 [Phycisphaerae bacterium]|nr:hypothetical protein [Phycisphaerae bacterium]HDZ44705.1 hypothetical protein [Phycisphaerae bacterium]
MVSFDEARAILSDPELAARRDTYFERMQAVFDGGADDREEAFVLFGAQVGVEAEPGKDFQADLEAAVCELAAEADLLRDEKVFRPLIFSVSAYGVHFVDRIFGSHGYAAADESLRYVHNDIGELPVPDVDNDPGWRIVREATKAFLAMDLAVPVFVGTCMSSALNQAMNLYSERFLLGLLDKPEGARRDLRVIVDVIKQLHQWYLDTVPRWQLQGAAPTVRAQPPGYGQIDGCSTHLLGPGQYRDFIAELDEEVLSLYPKGGMIHLCGNHIRHIRTWAQMSSLKSVQLSSVANEEVEAHVQGLRSDQVIYVGPTDVLPLERIMDATGGYRVILAADIQPPQRREPKIGRDRTSA